MDENQNQEGQNMEGGGMEQQPPQPQGDGGQAQPPMPEPAPAEGGQPYGPIVGIIIIVILLILAGFYFWGESLSDRSVQEPNPEETLIIDENGDGAAGTVQEGSEDAGTFDDTPTEPAETPLSESDAIEDLEAELDDTLLDELDAELENIDEELNF